MITKITTVEELKQIFTEALINNTDKVTKISDGSVLNGIAYGSAKLAQKVLKDVAIVEAHLFPDSAVGEYLDNIAKLRGVAPRLGQSKGSTYIRVVGTPGTTYIPNTHVFNGKGENFDLVEQVVIPDTGFTYAKVKSQSFGSNVNISALAINRVNPIPAGHDYAINEFKVEGGRDFEDDDLFRRRIKEEVNVLAKSTISYLEQVLRKINPDVLRVKNLGLNNVGDVIIAVSTVSGAELTNSELQEITLKSEQFLSMNELKPNGLNSYGIEFRNVSYFPIDVSFRADIDDSFDLEQVRKNIQIALNKVIDWRTWQDGSVIDWIDLINAVKGVRGVNRVLDNNFYPMTHTEVPRGYLPRMRGFTMMNLQGVIIKDLQGFLNPNFYPSIADLAYQATVLRSL